MRVIFRSIVLFYVTEYFSSIPYCLFLFFALARLTQQKKTRSGRRKHTSTKYPTGPSDERTATTTCMASQIRLQNAYNAATVAARAAATTPLGPTEAGCGAPRATDPGWTLRRASLLRALYPTCAPPEAAAAAPEPTPTNSRGGQLMLVPPPPVAGPTAAGVGSASLFGSTAGSDNQRKRPREGGDNGSDAAGSRAVIPIDADELRRRTAEANARGAAGAEAANRRPKWKLKRVSAGHKGTVRCLAMEPGGQWFASGSADCLVKVWDLASGKTRLNLPGHHETVRGLAACERTPYLYSCSEDHTVKCWDLEQNRVVRDFHGHLSAVYCVSPHPVLDLLVTGGRDATVRVWDLRTRRAVHTLQGHTDSVMTVATQGTDPQIVSGGADSFVFLWDLAAGKPLARLTRHKKPVRSIVVHPLENTMVTCGADNVRKWRLPTGEFFCNLNLMPGAPEEGLWNSATLSANDVLFVGAEGGGMRFYDWSTHTLYQHGSTVSVPGTLPGEGGILCCTFDRSGQRLLTGEGDKTIKMWREEETPASGAV